MYRTLSGRRGFLVFTVQVILSLHRGAYAYVQCRPSRAVSLRHLSFSRLLHSGRASLRSAYGESDNTDEYDEDSSGNFDSLGLTPDPNQEDDLLGYAIDSFLRGDYNLQFAEDAAAPHPGLGPGSTIETGLRSLRELNTPGPSHGAAVLMRFCVPLSRGERWGDSSRPGRDPWKEILRGALTPSMLARRIRASEFSGVLDWTSLDVTEGAYSLEKDLVGLPSIAFVNAALYFGDGVEPSLIQFTLRRVGGVWLIDTARHSPMDLFVKEEGAS